MFIAFWQILPDVRRFQSAGMSKDYLPIGFQLMSKPMDDYRLLKVFDIQAKTDFHIDDHLSGLPNPNLKN